MFTNITFSTNEKIAVVAGIAVIGTALYWLANFIIVNPTIIY